MDAEGAEKDILEMMSRQDASDAICKINMMWMEYHSFIFEEGTDEYDAHVKFENEFPTMFETKCGRKLEIGGWHWLGLLCFIRCQCCNKTRSWIADDVTTVLPIYQHVFFFLGQIYFQLAKPLNTTCPLLKGWYNEKYWCMYVQNMKFRS